MVEKNNGHSVPSELEERLLVYITERTIQPDRHPYNSKFAARTLAKRFEVTEQQIETSLNNLHQSDRIKILRLTNNLRGYRSK